MASESATGATRFAIPNTLMGLREGLVRLNAWLGTAFLRQETEDRANLIFEEIVTNIIRYAFDDRGEHQIEIVLKSDPETLTLEFLDGGRPFDPRKARKLPSVASLEEASIGGRGLFLVKNAAKGLDYERTPDGRNRLTIALQRTGQAH
jgi:anti-sigma regulatory factor (Ser/Thr protein kinase)